ncbi:hypothetical protein K458DRAFT_149086 [Lentithecium fluviatile CBS 122367]|uniref:Uncharacterized protein n=1 Tax=Lentithecium fluviatile CBS 122367 TaxID=1168545 RepID=A0A6G1JDC5_9PLEO|nr:hypothetical protein K458DRAFT_149086 [Lentithecium fluviatile CBS 122367]
MVNMSYLASEFFESRYEGMAEHFDAPRRLRSFYSSPVDAEQWKLEVDKMFATRLASLQFNALGLAEGHGKDLPRSRNLLDGYGIHVKRKILFPTNGWRNVKLDALGVAFAICIAVILITWREMNEVRSIRFVQNVGVLSVLKAWEWVAEQFERFHEIEYDVLCYRIDKKMEDLRKRLGV